jgi:hypothetical protein
MAEPSDSLRRAERLGYEPTDVEIRAVLWVALILIVVVILFAAALGGLVGLFRIQAEGPVSSLARVELESPPPRLEANPEQALENVRRHEDQALEGYGWVDRNAGIARIPIGRAMQILAARGWTSKAEPADKGVSGPTGSAEPEP